MSALTGAGLLLAPSAVALVFGPGEVKIFSKHMGVDKTFPSDYPTISHQNVWLVAVD